MKKPRRIVDVGCGMGGSSIYFAKKYGANCCGITLGVVEAQKAQALAVAEGLGDKVSNHWAPSSYPFSAFCFSIANISVFLLVLVL